jgi:hypothetical protein
LIALKPRLAAYVYVVGRSWRCHGAIRRERIAVGFFVLAFVIAEIVNYATRIISSVADSG